MTHLGIVVTRFATLQVSRNKDSASLPAGRMYFSFPVFTPELLAEQQLAKAEVEEKASGFMREKMEELQKFQDEKNLIMKALHYRNAVAAVEKLDYSGVHHYQHIPSGDNVIHIHDGLMASNKGTIFSIAPDFFKTKTYLGDAVIRPPAVDSETRLRP